MLCLPLLSFGGGWSPGGDSKKEFSSPNKNAGARSSPIDVCWCVKGRRQYRRRPSSSALATQDRPQTSKFPHLLWKQAICIERLLFPNCSGERLCTSKPRTVPKPVEWKKSQWDPDCFTFTGQWFSTTRLQPAGLRAVYAFKLSHWAYCTSI